VEAAGNLVREDAMRGRKTSVVVSLSAAERSELEGWQRSTTVRAGLARRARVILLLDEGHSFAAAARICGLTVRNTRKWVFRYLAHGVASLRDKPGRGRKPVFSPRGSVALG
jgi:Helix-turn-helix domain